MVSPNVELRGQDYSNTRHWYRRLKLIICSKKKDSHSLPGLDQWDLSFEIKPTRFQWSQHYNYIDQFLKQIKY